MISNQINTLLNELNSSTWNSVISTSKNSIMDYDTTSTTNWNNGYINTTTSSPDGITGLLLIYIPPQAQFLQPN